MPISSGVLPGLNPDGMRENIEQRGQSWPHHVWRCMTGQSGIAMYGPYQEYLKSQSPSMTVAALHAPACS